MSTTSSEVPRPQFRDAVVYEELLPPETTPISQAAEEMYAKFQSLLRVRAPYNATDEYRAVRKVLRCLMKGLLIVEPDIARNWLPLIIGNGMQSLYRSDPSTPGPRKSIAAEAVQGTLIIAWEQGMSFDKVLRYLRDVAMTALCSDGDFGPTTDVPYFEARWLQELIPPGDEERLRQARMSRDIRLSRRENGPMLLPDDSYLRETDYAEARRAHHRELARQYRRQLREWERRNATRLRPALPFRAHNRDEAENGGVQLVPWVDQFIAEERGENAQNRN